MNKAYDSSKADEAPKQFEYYAEILFVNVYLPLASLSRTKERFNFLLRTQAKAKVMKERAQRKLAE